MTNLKEIYKCMSCGNMVEVIHAGEGELTCCGKPMRLLPEMSNEEGKTEKHKPVIEGNLVKVGSVEHPMDEDHSIEWIEASNGKETAKVFLHPSEKPEATFSFVPTSAREYCNLHGLWKTE